MAMATVLLALMAGGVGGGVAGGLASWRVVRRRPADPLALDPDLDQQINAAAAQWARVHERPGVAPLVADKLRLAYVLSHRPRRRRRRWSR